MNIEEKEAIEWLKRLVKLNKRDNLDDTFAEILLNLIEKQSKEIEELKEKNFELEYLDTGKIMENKIKAKIEDIESQINDIKDNLDYEYNETMVNEVWRLENKIDVLQSLLEKE